MKFTIEIDIPELDTFQTKAEQIAAIEGRIEALINMGNAPRASEPGTLTTLLAEAQNTMKSDAPDHLPEMVTNAYREAVKYFIEGQLSTAFIHQLGQLKDMIKTYERYLNYSLSSPAGMEASLRNVERYLGSAAAERLRQQARHDANNILDQLNQEKETV